MRSKKRSTQKPFVAVIVATKCVVDADTNLCGVDGSLEIGVDVGTFVALGEKVVEVPHADAVLFRPEVRIAVELTAAVVDLAVCDKQTRNRTLCLWRQGLIKAAPSHYLRKL